MYEVELKTEITAAEKEVYIDTLKSKGFSFIKSTSQHDTYAEVQESPYGGYDIKRYRDEDGTYIYTQKTWERIEDDKHARKEVEQILTKEEFEAIIAKYPEAVSFKKQRDWYRGEYQGYTISVTIDSIKFDHSPAMRYFTEAEIGVQDKAQVSPTKLIIIECLKDLLGKSELIEAPGMFAMAFKKL